MCLRVRMNMIWRDYENLESGTYIPYLLLSAAVQFPSSGSEVFTNCCVISFCVVSSTAEKNGDLVSKTFFPIKKTPNKSERDSRRGRNRKRERIIFFFSSYVSCRREAKRVYGFIMINRQQCCCWAEQEVTTTQSSYFYDKVEKGKFCLNLSRRKKIFKQHQKTVKARVFT